MAPKEKAAETAKPAPKTAIVRALLDMVAPGGTLEQRMSRIEVMVGMILLHSYAPTIAGYVEQTASAMWH